MASIPSMQKKDLFPSSDSHILTPDESRSISEAINTESHAMMERKAAKVAERMSQAEEGTKEGLASSPSHSMVNITEQTQPSITQRNQSTKDVATNPRIIAPSDRIRQLNELDARIPALLQSASDAIGALAPQSSPSHAQAPLASQQETFKAASSAYFKTLSQIDRELRRQIYALEAAGIIPAEIAKKTPTSGFKRTHAQTMSGNPANQTGAGADGEAENPAPLAGGVGNLDIGWLNSRNGLVEKEMESELWADAEELVRRMEEDGKMEGLLEK